MSTRIRIGSVAPDFEAETTAGKIRFHEWKGDSWCVFFSHPADRTPVCTTELGQVAKMQADFAKRNCKVIGLSCDSVDDHKAWIGDITEITGCGKFDYPLIADQTRAIAKTYDMLDEDDVTNRDSKGLPLTVRSVFILKPDHKIAMIMTYPASAGRNFDEILRVLDSIQLTVNKALCTPANWVPGGKLVVAPSVSTADAKKKYGESKVEEVRPWLRFVPGEAAQVE